MSRCSLPSSCWGSDESDDRLLANPLVVGCVENLFCFTAVRWFLQRYHWTFGFLTIALDVEKGGKSGWVGG